MEDLQRDEIKGQALLNILRTKGKYIQKIKEQNVSAVQAQRN